MKSLSTKLLAITCIFALATGCASVTDAGLTQDEPQIEQTVAPDAESNGVENGNSMEPIRDKPILD